MKPGLMMKVAALVIEAASERPTAAGEKASVPRA